MTASFARVALAALVTLGGAATAQEVSENRVAAQTDWSVFVESDPTECWGVSAPREQENTRDGQPVTVRRGDALLFIAYRPGSNVAGEVSFTGGYPFADDSTVQMTIGGDSYELFTEGEWAWPASPDVDAEIVERMRTGAEAVLVGRSGRGTRTEDTFSLLGFTAALEEAGNRCGG